MNFEISRKPEMIAETARDFAEKNIRPHIMDWDESQHFQRFISPAWWNGLLWELLSRKIMEVPDFLTMNMKAIVDEISQVDPSIGLSVAVTIHFAPIIFMNLQNEEQRMKWLPQLASGKVIGAWDLLSNTILAPMPRNVHYSCKRWWWLIINGAKKLYYPRYFQVT